MEQGSFYFLKEKYFLDFPNQKLEQNKETIDGQPRLRPCFYSLFDENTGLYWMIPISSKLVKYHGEYEKAVLKYGVCHTIVFGTVMNKEKAFLIQNFFPTTPKYILNEYFDSSSGMAVRISREDEEKILKKTRIVLKMIRRGIKIVFPDVLAIEKKLLNRA